MKNHFLAFLLAACTAQAAYSGPYALSADGATVVRLTPQGTVAASALTSAMLTPGWSATAGSGGSLGVTSYDAGYKSGAGGAQFTALYDNGAPLAAGKS